MGNSSEGASEIDRYNHPRLGNIKRIQQANSNQYIGYEIVMQNQKIYDEWVKELRFIKSEEQVDEILFLPTDYSFKQTAYCGTGGMATLRYQDYLYSLLPQIINRRQIKRPFNEQELLYLFYSLAKISSILEKKNRVIGDVKPENILVNQDGYVKIISQFSWPGQSNKFARGWEKGNERLLLSPEECEERHKKKQAIVFNAQDSCSEVFSIGLTILEAGTLRDCSEIYGDTYEYRFNEVKVREYLDIFESRYSKEMSEMVREMLHPNPKKRWKSEYIYKILKPYEYQILYLEEIAIKLNSSTYIPRIQREEKISIKKMGDSHHSYNQNHQLSNEKHLNNSQINQVSSKISHNNEFSPQQLRNTLTPQQPQQPQQPIMPPYQSSIHYMWQSNPNQLPPININGSTYHPDGFPNYQLVNENTNFGRQLVPQPQPQPQPQQQPQNNQPVFYTPNNFMANSLPLHLSQHNQQSHPQYITQNSMIANVGRPMHDTTYILSNQRNQFY